MVIKSVGYAGTVTDADWRNLATKAVSNLYGVEDVASWRVTVAPGDRTVQVAAGGAYGLGVFDTNDAPVPVQLGTVAAGSRWDLIAAHRDWALGKTTIVAIPGSSARQIPARAFGFGGVNDQPLALVRLDAGKTAPQEIIDLRCIVGDGGMIAFDDLARQYLDRVGTSVRIRDVLWSRVLDSLGSPAWVSSNQADTGWVSLAPGKGWRVANGYKFEVRAVGDVVSVRGVLVFGKDASVSNFGVVPEVFRPTMNTPLGAYHAGFSGTHTGELMVTPAGVLLVPNSYYDGSLVLDAGVPIHGTWLRG